MHLQTVLYYSKTFWRPCAMLWSSGFLEFFYYWPQWLRLAVSEGPNRVGVPPFLPSFTWGCKQNQFPKRRNFNCSYFILRTIEKLQKPTTSQRCYVYLQHDFYNKICKIKHKLYFGSGSVPPKLKLWVRARLFQFTMPNYPPHLIRFWIEGCLNHLLAK
jgi:hypothetical protein